MMFCLLCTKHRRSRRSPTKLKILLSYHFFKGSLLARTYGSVMITQRFYNLNELTSSTSAFLLKKFQNDARKLWTFFNWSRKPPKSIIDDDDDHVESSFVSLGVHPSLSGSQVLEQRIDEAWEDDEAIMN